MRSGETDKSKTIIDQDITKTMCSLAQKLGHVGNLDSDIMRKDGKIYVLDLNPRFGGGYPHAYESGVNVPALIFQNLRGETTANTVGQYKKGICMMKYNEVMIKDMNGTILVP